ncbi:hypothetical protein SASPL_116758 [Salvia splendens]|uniref:Retrotransposon gag domain-containing protein n=1 Tax=Salvia splendens TaxID=180675 RepID=A0A8X8ZXJ2_SALSN|nr:hypothetical protein SASPL_116758 [Salvia splendens]
MSKNVESVSFGFKLDGKNFSVWSRLMRIIIGNREKLQHLEGDQAPPKTTDPEFNKWQASDFSVFTWLIQNMEPKLVLQFAQHQTAKALWRSLITTFGVRADLVQAYDQEIRTNQLKQGNESLEQYWGDLQQLWVEIDARRPCPYTCCEKGINTYKKETEIKRLYQFLSGLDDKYDALRRELLKQSPEPSAEDAFGIVKQEETRTGIWKPSNPMPYYEIGPGFGGRAGGPTPPRRHYTRTPPPPRDRGRSTTDYLSNRPRIDKSKLVCSHCGKKDGHKTNRNPVAKGRSAIGRTEGGEIFAAPMGGQAATSTGGDGGRPAALPSGSGGQTTAADRWSATGIDVGGGAAAMAVFANTVKGKGFGDLSLSPSSFDKYHILPQELACTPLRTPKLQINPQTHFLK